MHSYPSWKAFIYLKPAKWLPQERISFNRLQWAQCGTQSDLSDRWGGGARPYIHGKLFISEQECWKGCFTIAFQLSSEMIPLTRGNGSVQFRGLSWGLSMRRGSCRKTRIQTTLTAAKGTNRHLEYVENACPKCVGVPVHVRIFCSYILFTFILMDAFLKTSNQEAGRWLMS